MAARPLPSGDVMLENYKNLVSLGLVSEPDLVTFMEQKKGPWDVKGMETIAIHPGTGAPHPGGGW
uniref:KRAB domain-containing protein n=1 Tax=Balaenoptera musculus TaxID=9771 RepID=A0A8C0DUB9_BALMU